QEAGRIDRRHRLRGDRAFAEGGSEDRAAGIRVVSAAGAGGAHGPKSEDGSQGLRPRQEDPLFQAGQGAEGTDQPVMPDVLFAPWRYEYLVSDKTVDCIFCEAAASSDDDASLVVFRGKRVFVLLNRYPYTNGHVMVAPLAHEAWFSDSPSETLGELIAVVARAQKILVRELRTDGLNVGVNFGSAAGAGVAGH